MGDTKSAQGSSEIGISEIGSSATRGKLRTRRLVSFRSALIVFGIVGWAMALSVGSSFGDGDPGTFDPTVTFETSTTQAAANPDARITIDNTGNTASIRSMILNLPNGLWGSLNSVASKCQTFEPGAGDTGSDDCTAANKIGTVSTKATIDESEATLDGDIYLVQSYNPDYVAFLGVKVHAKVGGVDLGYVRAIGFTWVRGNGEGITTQIEDIPTSITQTVGSDERTVSFHVDKMVVDLVSDLDGSLSPLLTNPSKCGNYELSGILGPEPTLGDAFDVPFQVPYQVDGCDNAKFGVDSFDFSPSNPTAAGLSGFTATISFPSGNSGLDRVKVQLPAGFGPSFPSFGVAADQCPPTAAPSINAVFDPTNCPDQALVGYVYVYTPLLPDPLMGEVYLIDNTPLPWFGIDINPSVGSNPPGLTLRMLAATNLTNRDATCRASGTPVPPPAYDSFCQQVIEAEFVNIPDAPVTSIVMDLNGPPRTGVNASLPGEILVVASASNCRPQDEVLANFTSQSTVDDETATKRTNVGVSTVNFTGCNNPPVAISGAPVGAVTSDTTPTFTIAPGTSPGPNFFCGISAFSNVSPGTACTTSHTPSSALAPGTHRIFAGTTATANGTHAVRGFAVHEDPPAPGPAPDTTFDGTPPAVTGPTPTFDFTSTQSSTFQCAIDGGAFLPCGSSTPSLSGSFTVAAADAFFVGSEHTFAVRAQNEEGTVDVTPASATFDVSLPFDPTLSVLSTSTQARAHPDLDVTIENDSEEKLAATEIKLPDGFMGGLQGVQTRCEPAVADAGNCPASSKVGTIDTEATVDGSETIVRISGDVFLTKKLQPTDVAGLSIKVDAVIQEIDLGSIIVPARLKLRGNAQGVDSMVIDIPESIVPSNPFGDTETFFTLRKLTLKLRTGVGAAQPLLTNASACGTSNFSAEFTGNGSPSPSTTGPVLVPYTVTGCENLGFSPALSASMVRSADGQLVNSTEYQPINFTATVAATPDQAGIKDASVLLPKPITIDVLKLPIGLCEEAQYLTDTCAASTIIGNATATSPLLPAGEILQGNIYLLKAVPPRVIPRLFVRLKGLDGGIAISLVGVSSFENATQIRTEFTGLPDAPLNSFTMNVNNFLLSQKSPCQDAATFGSSITGTLTGHNGKTSPVNAGLQLNCKGIYGTSKYKKGKSPTQSLSLEARYGQPGFKSAKLQYGKLLTINKKRVKKALVVKANGKKLAAKCYRIKGRNVLDLTLCKKTYTKLEISFKKGALVGGKKLNKPTVKLTLKDAGGNSYSKTLDLRKNISSAELMFQGK